MEGSSEGHEKTLELAADEGRFLSFIRSRVGSLEEAEEILQMAYLRSLEKGDQVRDDSSVVSWFFSVIRHAIADHFRGRGREKLEQAEPGWWERVESEAHAAAQESAVGCVRVALRALRPDDAELIEAVDLKGQEIGTVADGLGVSPAALSVRLFRARAALRARLQELCRTCTATRCLYCKCEFPESAL